MCACEFRKFINENWGNKKHDDDCDEKMQQAAAEFRLDSPQSQCSVRKFVNAKAIDPITDYQQVSERSNIKRVPRLGSPADKSSFKATFKSALKLDVEQLHCESQPQFNSMAMELEQKANNELNQVNSSPGFITGVAAMSDDANDAPAKLASKWIKPNITQEEEDESNSNNLYATLIRYFSEMENNLYLSMGKTDEEIERIHQADLVDQKNRKKVLLRQNSLIDRQSKQMKQGSMPWQLLRQSDTWSSKNLISTFHERNKTYLKQPYRPIESSPNHSPPESPSTS